MSSRRALDIWEREMILSLIQHAPSNCAALAQQLTFAEAEDQQDSDIALFVCDDGRIERPAFSGVCAEAVYRDVDGNEASLLLHVDRGVLYWLERLKLYPSPLVITKPDISAIERFVIP